MENFELYLQYHKEITENKLKTINRFIKQAKPKPVKRTSKVGIVENILKLSGKPLHISKIIEIAARDFEIQLERDSITSILTKKIKAGQKFIRTAPNTFSLKK
jgi:hypothetical protein